MEKIVYKGDCFKTAIENLNCHPEWNFCFGYVTINVIRENGEKGKETVLHGWNEDETNAYDFSSNQNIILPKREYYKKMHIIGLVFQTKKQVDEKLKIKNTSGWWCEELIKKAKNQYQKK